MIAIVKSTALSGLDGRIVEVDTPFRQIGYSITTMAILVESIQVGNACYGHAIEDSWFLYNKVI